MEKSVLKIQRAFRKWFYRNAVCCISLEKVNYPCFIYKTSGVCIFYDYLALNKYFKTSNKIKQEISIPNLKLNDLKMN